jgi:aminoglycoside phosphotransferase (APT) family kinase protein
LTADWFDAALPLPAGVTVAAAEVESIIWGTATKVFVNLEYRGPGTSELPGSVCVKGGFNPNLRPMAGPGYLAEALFFRHLAPALKIPLPRCWYADQDPETGQGIVVLEDLHDSGVEFPTMVDPLSPAAVAEALAVLASLHAATWDGQGLETSGWLTVGSPVQRQIIRIMLGEDHWNYHLGLPRGEGLPESMLDRERVLAGFEELWSADDAAPHVLSHGDAHMGNLYFRPDPAFLDWQGVCRAPWADDVTYLIGGALTTEDRRAHERDLLDGYLEALRTCGVTPPDADTAWAAYRRHHLHGFVWLLVPEAMQPEPVCAAMGRRYAWACDDHRVFDALGVEH